MNVSDLKEEIFGKRNEFFGRIYNLILSYYV